MTRPLQDGVAVWYVVMRGRAGFVCRVPVSVSSALTQQRARELAREMFPELALDASEIDVPAARRERQE